MLSQPSSIDSWRLVDGRLDYGACISMYRKWHPGFWSGFIACDCGLMFQWQPLSTACFSIFVTLTRNGVGRHVEFYTSVRPDLLTIFFELAWWYSWIVVMANTSIKISIACFLLHLADHRRHWQWVLYSIIGTLASP